jgi:hypothetical protein
MLPPLFIILQDMGMNNWIFRILSRGKVLNWICHAITLMQRFPMVLDRHYILAQSSSQLTFCYAERCEGVCLHMYDIGIKPWWPWLTNCLMLFISVLILCTCIEIPVAFSGIESPG